MAILKQINEIKDLLSKVEKEALQLDKEIQHQVLDSLKDCREALNQAGASLEKHSKQDEMTLDIKKDLLDKMEKDELYHGVPQDKRQKMVDKIIESSTHIFMKERELKEYLTKTLKFLKPEDLVKKAYTKEELVKLGTTILGPEKSKNASEYLKYNEGLDFAVSSQAKFSNKQDTEDKALQRILKNPSLRTSYLYAYYGV